MIENKKSERAKNNARKISSESAREYVARAKGLANAVRNNIDVEDEKICRHILTGLPSDYDFVRKGFALQDMRPEG